jgi:hypothetical protein
MKSDQKTVRKRVEEILSIRLLGALPTDIRRHAEEQGWQVGERQLQRYTAMSDELMAESLEKNRDKLMAYHFAARRALYARAMAVSDYSTAKAVLKDEAELLCLYPAKRLQMTGQDGGPVVLNITEEIVGQPVPVKIQEEVINNEHDASQANQTSPCTTSLPQE